nr:hypothetical protein Iba_chr02bCG5800 [Ipomoea batatas]
MAKAIATEDVSWPAKSKLRTKSRICSLERLELLRTQPRRSLSCSFMMPCPLSSIFLSMNLRIVDRDCRAFLYAVPGKFNGAETTPFMKVIYSFFSFSVSRFPGSKLIICSAMKLNSTFLASSWAQMTEFSCQEPRTSKVCFSTSLRSCVLSLALLKKFREILRISLCISPTKTSIDHFPRIPPMLLG